MSQFNYEAYAEAIRGLATLPAEMQQLQQRTESFLLSPIHPVAI